MNKRRTKDLDKNIITNTKEDVSKLVSSGTSSTTFPITML